MTKVFIWVTACEKRFLDAKKIQKYLIENNYEIINKPNDADIIIFVTCGFTNEVSRDVLKQIKEFQKYDAELIVAGCIPAIEKEELGKIFDGKTITTKELGQIDRLFPENRIKFSNIDDAHNLFENPSEEKYFKILKKIPFFNTIYNKIKGSMVKILFGKYSHFYMAFMEKSFYRITISGGCLGNCSYCAIKKGVGPLRSKPLNQIVKEFKKGLDEGHKRFTTESDDTGAYGIDIGNSFPELYDELTKIPGDYKIVCGGPSPIWLVKYIDELEEILKRKKVTGLEVAIQSGSSRILKLMRRYSDTEKIKETLLRIRKTFPDLQINTHIIVGFPTETDEDWEQTLSFIKDVKFHGGLIFSFSCKSGTKAENIEPKVTEKEKLERMKHAKKTLRSYGYHVIEMPHRNQLVFSLND